MQDKKPKGPHFFVWPCSCSDPKAIIFHGRQTVVNVSIIFIETEDLAT